MARQNPVETSGGSIAGAYVGLESNKAPAPNMTISICGVYPVALAPIHAEAWQNPLANDYASTRWKHG
jgi:hypothetical protein